MQAQRLRAAKGTELRWQISNAKDSLTSSERSKSLGESSAESIPDPETIRQQASSALPADQYQVRRSPMNAFESSMGCSRWGQQWPCDEHAVSHALLSMQCLKWQLPISMEPDLHVASLKMEACAFLSCIMTNPHAGASAGMRQHSS